MTSKEVLLGKQEEILTLWDANREEALKVLRPYLQMTKVQRADRKFNEARNACYLNELILPDEALDALTDLFNIMAEWLSYAEYPKERGERWRPDRKALNGALEKVHVTLRAALMGNSIDSSVPGESRATTTAHETHSTPLPRAG